MSRLIRELYRRLPLLPLEAHLRGGDCLVFNQDPLVLYAFDWVLENDDGALLAVFRHYRKAPVYLLMAFSWCRENAWHVARLTAWHKRHLRRHPNHRVVFMANTATQHRALRDAGLRAVFVNHNAFVDPAIFRPLPAVEKRFDAVYDARVCEFKRHHLAAGVGSLALITARIEQHHDEAYARSIGALLTRAHWYNDPLAPDYRSLKRDEINARLNECRVGLCLSAEEGPMYASMQYLLAGLPVVSTASRGGRDVFFDPDYVRIVADHPDAVAEAVREMTRCPVPAAEIRARALARIAEHQQRLFELLDAIARESGQDIDWRPRWPLWAAGGMRPGVTPAALFERIRDADRPAPE